MVESFQRALTTLVPAGIRHQQGPVTAPDGPWDATFRWEIENTAMKVGVEVSVYPPRVPPRTPATPGSQVDLPVLVAPFIAPGVQRALRDAGRSYWDTTGNIFLLSHEPWLLVDREGAKKDPTPVVRESPALKSLKGRTASEVIVALLQRGGRVSTIRDFAQQTRLPLASVSRVLSLLRDENYCEPNAGGSIVLRDPIEVARRWADDYSFTKTFHARRYFSISSLPVALARATQADLPYAITGSQAASSWFGEMLKPTAFPTDEKWIYVANLHEAERIFDLSADPRHGQIWLAECDFLEREPLRKHDGQTFVTPWRAVGDLLSAGGRRASIGEDLARDLMREFVQ